VIKIEFNIMGKKWAIKTLEHRSYKRKHGKDSVAITQLHKRRIVLNKKLGSDLETIVHELVHAYKYELCVHSSQLDHDAIEEFYCELFAKRAQEILSLADILHVSLLNQIGEDEST